MTTPATEAKPKGNREDRWRYIVAIEPRLLHVERRIRAVRKVRGRPFCANRHWYGTGARDGFKQEMEPLVGWQAKDPRIRTEWAYDDAYEHLYHLLPDCSRESHIC